MSTFRKKLRAMHLEALLELPSQGKAMDCVAVDRSSSRFLKTGELIRFADWRTCSRSTEVSVDQHGNKSCRRCDFENETLPRVINHCMRYAEIIARRHNAIVSRIKKAASKRFTIPSENESVAGTLRPD